MRSFISVLAHFGMPFAFGISISNLAEVAGIGMTSWQALLPMFFFFGYMILREIAGD